jgi:putative transposase
MNTDRHRGTVRPASVVEGRACESEAVSLPERMHPAHHPPLNRPNCPTIIFLTICTKNRRKILARPEVHDLLLTCWSDADSWMVGRYVLMPDHIHLFCSPADGFQTPLRKWIFRWRAAVTRQWLDESEKPIWQKDFFDRQLRNGESYEQKWNYVFENPVRAGFVRDPTEWAYRGEVNPLGWNH